MLLAVVCTSPRIHRRLAPATANLALSPSVPTVGVGVGVTPAAANLVLSSVAPTINTGINTLIIPAGTNLILSGAAPSVDVAAAGVTQPQAAQLVMNTDAPTIEISNNFTLIPAAANLILSSSPPTIPGESSWTQVGSVTASGATVDFTGLTGYSEFLVFHRGTTLDGAGQRILQVSSDNGANWEDDVGDYDLIAETGVETQAGSVTILHSTGSGSARDCCIHLVCCNLTTPPKPMEGRTKVLAQISASYTVGSEINAIRNLISGASNYTGGTIKVYAR